MAMPVGTIVGEKDFFMDFFLSAALVAGQLVIREATASDTGEIEDPTTTAAADAVGVSMDAVAYDATPETYEPGAPSRYSLENMARIMCNPFQIIRFQILGGAAVSGLATTSPANVITNTAADAAAPYGLISAAEVGSIDMTNGLVKGRTGNNAGALRKLTAHSNGVSCTVAMGFLNPLAANDTFIRVPYSRAVATVQLTTNLVNANGIIASGTGAALTVVNVKIDEQKDLAWVDVVMRDAWLNPESA